MKTIFLTIMFTVLMCMVCTKSIAHDIEAKNDDGVTIYYVWINNNTELAVSFKGSEVYGSNAYSGNVVIPSSVTYNGSTYSVTKIGGGAFFGCRWLTSVTIPNSVKRIENNTFYF